MAEDKDTLSTEGYEEIEDTPEIEDIPTAIGLSPLAQETTLAKVSAPPKESKLAKREKAALVLIEEHVFRSAMEMIEGMNAFSDIEPDATEPPQEWIQDLGKKMAWKKFRIAKASWMGSKEAPIALRIVPPIAGAIMRARVGLTPMESQQRALPIKFPVADITMYEEIVVKE